MDYKQFKYFLTSLKSGFVKNKSEEVFALNDRSLIQKGFYHVYDLWKEFDYVKNEFRDFKKRIDEKKLNKRLDQMENRIIDIERIVNRMNRK